MAQAPPSALPWIRVGGMVVDSHGWPPMSSTTVLTIWGPAVNETADLDPSGQFEFLVPTAGEYRIYVSIRSRLDRRLLEYASRTLPLAHGSSKAFVIRTTPAAALDGRVRFEGVPPTAADTIAISPEDGTGRGGFVGIQPAPVSGNAFEFLTFAGAWLLRPNGAGMRGRALQAVLCNGVDVTDAPTEFSPADDIEVVVTSKVGAVDGHATKGDGDAAD